MIGVEYHPLPFKISLTHGGSRLVCGNVYRRAQSSDWNPHHRIEACKRALPFLLSSGWSSHFTQLKPSSGPCLRLRTVAAECHQTGNRITKLNETCKRALPFDRLLFLLNVISVVIGSNAFPFRCGNGERFLRVLCSHFTK